MSKMVLSCPSREVFGEKAKLVFAMPAPPLRGDKFMGLITF